MTSDIKKGGRSPMPHQEEPDKEAMGTACACDSGNDLADQLAACLVRNAACVLADIKPAALFSFTPRFEREARAGRPYDEPRASAPGARAFEPRADPRGPDAAPSACLVGLASAARPREDFSRVVRRCAWRLSCTLSARGLRVDVLYTWERRALILVSRTCRVCELLARPDVCSFLQDAGYLTDSPQHVLSCLHHRLRRYEGAHTEVETPPGGVRDEAVAATPSETNCPCTGGCASCPSRPSRPWGAVPYPHEIGVLLGYPLSDVQAFIELQGHGAVDVGPWKVYGNAEQARRRWERMRACEQEIRQRWEQGAPLEALVS